MWRFFGAITGFIKDVLCYSASPKVVTAVVLELLEPMSEAVIDERSSWKCRASVAQQTYACSWWMIPRNVQRNSSIPCV